MRSIELSKVLHPDYLRLACLITGNQIVLVLSGGAARGLAHYGLIMFLLEHNISFDVIIDVSMGSEIGASYCVDLDYDKHIERQKAGIERWTTSPRTSDRSS
jgi:predicted acylesterase/phospholipase RssA